MTTLENWKLKKTLFVNQSLLLLLLFVLFTWGSMAQDIEFDSLVTMTSKDSPRYSQKVEFLNGVQQVSYLGTVKNSSNKIIYQLYTTARIAYGATSKKYQYLMIFVDNKKQKTVYNVGEKNSFPVGVKNGAIQFKWGEVEFDHLMIEVICFGPGNSCFLKN